MPLGSREPLIILAESWDVIFHIFITEVKNTQIANRVQTSSSLYLQGDLGEDQPSEQIPSPPHSAALGKADPCWFEISPTTSCSSVVTLRFEHTAANTAPCTSNTLKDGLGLPRQPSTLGIPTLSPPAALREHLREALLQPQPFWSCHPALPPCPALCQAAHLG